MANSSIARIYEHLRSQYPLTLTTTLAVDDGFTIDAPILVGRGSSRSFWLYDDGGDFVFSVEVPGQPWRDHWHPQTIKEAVQAVVDFMEGRA